MREKYYSPNFYVSKINFHIRISVWIFCCFFYNLNIYIESNIEYSLTPLMDKSIQTKVPGWNRTRDVSGYIVPMFQSCRGDAEKGALNCIMFFIKNFLKRFLMRMKSDLSMPEVTFTTLPNDLSQSGHFDMSLQEKHECD